MASRRGKGLLNASGRRWAGLPGVVFLAVSIGIGAAGYAYQRGQEQLVRARAEEQLSAVADSKVSQIVVWWRERAGDARLCVSTPVTAEPALALVAGRASRGVRDALAKFYENLLRSYHYRSVCLADERGQVLLRAGESCASPSSLASLWDRAIRGDAVVFSDLLVGPDTGEPHLAVVAPLHRGSERGAVILRMDARDFLFPLLRSWPTRTETGEIHLVRREAERVVDLSEPKLSWGSVRVTRPGSAHARASVGEELPPALAVLEAREPRLAREHHGESVLAVARAVPATPWFVVVTMDAREFQGPARRSGYAVGAVVGILVLGAASALTLWWRRQTRSFVMEQRRLEAKLDEARLRSLTRHINDIELILRPDGSIVEVNDRAIAAYGYARETLQTMSVCALGASGPERIRQDLTEIASRGAIRLESEHRRCDGSTFPVEVSARVFRTDGAEYTHLLIRDLTERRRAEAELRLAEERLRLALEGSGASFWDWDLPARRLHVDARWGHAARSEAGAFEASPEAPPDVLVAEEDRPQLRQQLAACLADAGAVLDSEHRVRARSGELVWVRLNGRVVERRADGSPLRLSGTIADVTARKRLEHRLARAERLASVATLASGTAHEINNPLSCVIANASYALGALDGTPASASQCAAATEDPDELRNALRDVIEGAQRVRNIVADLKRFSMAQERAAGRSELGRAIEQALRRAAPSLQSCRRVGVDVGRLPAVQASETSLVEAFSALLVNAGQATASGPNDVSIKGCLTPSGDRVAVEIEDTGKGIAPDVLRRIFDPYFTTKGAGGRGIGLSVCLGIVKSLGGEIEVESVVEEGSVFRVLLPVAAREASPADPADGELDPPP